METVLFKLLTKDKQARIYYVDNTLLLDAIDDKSFKNAFTSDIFYTSATFCCFLHGMMTSGNRVSVKLETSDSSAFLICGANANGSIQGYASDDYRQKDYADLQSMIGTSGCLKVIRDNGQGAIFTGIVDLMESSMQNNLAHYFSQSEQTKTTIHYFRDIQNTKVQLSRGVLIQALPFAESSLISDWESRIGSHAQAFAAPNLSTEDMLRTVFSDADIIEQFPIRLMCTCSREMILEMLLGLGVHDLEWTLNDSQDIEVKCNKCGKRYRFGADEIRSLLE